MSYCLHRWFKFSPAPFGLLCVPTRASQPQQVASHVLLMNFNLHPFTVLTNNIRNTLQLEDGQQRAQLSESDRNV